MSKILGKITLFIFINFFFLEFFSLIATKFNLLRFNDIPIYSFKEKRDGMLWREENSIWGPWHKKNYKDQHTSRCFDVEYLSNNIGARDNNDYLEEEPASIVLIGDSFAEGYGVHLYNTFSKIVENKKKRVLNFGVAGAGPRNEYLLKKNLIDKFKYDEIIYMFLPDNDFINYDLKYNTRYLNNKNAIYINNTLDVLARFTYTYNTLRSAKYLYYDLIKFKNYKVKSYRSYSHNDKASIDSSLFYVKKILNSNNDVKKSIIIIPRIEDIIKFHENKDYKEYYWYKNLKLIADENNVKLIDLLDYSLFEVKHLYFHSCDGHWSAYGNNFAAKKYLENK